MIAYEIATAVHDAHIDVDPALEGQRVRAIILASDTEAEEEAAAAPPPRFGTVGIPGVTELSNRDRSHPLLTAEFAGYMEDFDNAQRH